MRTLYDPLLHGSGRHIGSEVWVSFALGPLGRYPYHHSHLMVTCLDLASSGLVVRQHHTLLHLYPTLFPYFFYIPLHFLLSSSIVVSLHERRVFWSTSPFAWHCSLMCWSSRFTHMILRHLALSTQGFGIIYWVYRPLFPIISFTFDPWPMLRPD